MTKDEARRIAGEYRQAAGLAGTAAVLIPIRRDSETRLRFPNQLQNNSRWRTEGVCHGGCHCGAGGLFKHELRRLAGRVKNAGQARRLLAIAAVLDGASREAAAKVGGMDRQTLRDWVIRFNQQGPDGLINKCSPGAPGKLSKKHKAFLAPAWWRMSHSGDPRCGALARLRLDL